MQVTEHDAGTISCHAVPGKILLTTEHDNGTIHPW
jgi:hypothetical protein